MQNVFVKQQVLSGVHRDHKGHGQVKKIGVFQDAVKKRLTQGICISILYVVQINSTSND